MGRYVSSTATGRSINVRLIALAAGLTLGGSAQAAMILVNSSADVIASDGDCTLREAVINANNNDQSGSADCVAGQVSPTLDVIQFDAVTDNNPIVLSLTGINENAAATGDLDITESVIISGNGADTTTVIDGNATDRVFEIRNGAEAQLLSLNATNGGSVTAGAGIYLFEGSLLLQDAVVSNNTISGSAGTLQGAGIFAVDNLSLLRAKVSGNEIAGTAGASGFGAGISISLDGAVDISSSLIENNVIETVDGGAAGAGLYTNGNALANTGISSSVFRGNQAITTGDGGASGGALNHQSGDLGIQRSSFLNNLVRRTSAGNGSVANGGAIQAFDPISIRNSTFSGNRAESVDSSTGGAIALNDSGTLNNVTIFSNHVQASSGANAVAGGLRGNPLVTISNSVVAGNTSNDDAPDCNGTINSAGYNFIGNNSGCGFVMFTGEQIGNVAGGGSSLNPQLAGLSNNGGGLSIDGQNVTVLTHAPLEGSPLIDTGDPTPLPGGTCESIDQVGTGKTVDGDEDGGAFCDIGAIEFTGESTAGLGGSGGSGGGGALSFIALLFASLVAYGRRLIVK